MILARWPRWKGLMLLFAVQFVLGIVLGPLIAAPMLLEERMLSPGEAVGEYARYLWWIVSLDWVSNGDGGWILIAACLAWAGLAVAFISPIVGSVQREPSGRALWSSVVAAAVMGAVMAGMLFAAIFEGALALISADKPSFSASYDELAPWIWLSALAVWCATGAVWTLLLRRIGRSRDPGALDRLLRLVFAGSAVELTLGLPIYLMARKKYSCYCGMATFLNLVMGVAALCWLCGPWTVLLATREVRRRWRRGVCPRCGYPLRSGSSVCSECGTQC